ncbi:MAG TPA: transcription-repair coupling factor [bacterium]|nr:transcription-repair coupling factor [bacterium]
MKLSDSSLYPVIELLRQGKRSLRVMSLAGSSGSFLAALMVRELRRPVFFVEAEESEAGRAAAEMEFYARALDARALVRHLGGRDLLRTMPGQAGGQRTAALAAMIASTPERPAMIAASLDSALLVTAPPEIFSDHLHELRPGSRLMRERFLEALIRSGYTAVSSVMEPGDFSVRGGIIDVFAPGAELPARIELFGDEVESLRAFDPETQKSTGPIERVLIPPLKEVILTDESAARAVAVLNEQMMELKEGRLTDGSGTDVIKDFGDVVSRLSRQDHFPGIEAMLPAFFPGRSCAFDFLDPSWVVVYHEPFLCDQAFRRRLELLDEQWRDELARGLFALPPSRHFLNGPEVERGLAECAAVAAGPEPAAGPVMDAGHPESGAENYRAPAPPAADAGPVAGVSSDLAPFRARPELTEPIGPFISALRDFADMGVRALIVSPMPGKADRMKELLSGHGIDLPLAGDAAGALVSGGGALIAVGGLQRGFADVAGKLAVVPEAEIFGEKIRPGKKPRALTQFISDLSDLGEGDFVVHVEHGVGIYRGLTSLSVQWVGEWDFVNLRERPKIRVDSARIAYAQGSMLYVPVHRINQISKYSGPTEVPPALDTLGGNTWERVKKRVKRAVREFAEYLVRIHAERQSHPGVAFPAPDHVFREFEETFDYEETPDQLRAIGEVLDDMGEEKPMDRVVCGDVGYGKTEVALRAAFLAGMAGGQVAVLVPTTILAQQHYETFTKRLAKYPLLVRTISRFESVKEQKAVVAGLAAGTIDIVIGTHRLLSKDVKFRDLGLLVIDEEHRFGVRHKERLRELKATVDTLTLTATPIPRTLHMALAGLRDLSIIDTPPPDRLAVHTELVRADDRIIREAIERELRRQGQVFYVHNRVQTIEAAANKVMRLTPSARVAVAHGQMDEKALAKVMHDFVGRRFDVLVCTAIIESGLDIPTVNTMLIDRADQFGLAQLYQLRGRIGRSKERGYCFLIVPAKGILTKEAAQRLRALKEFTELGSGFRVAAHDLEIRGAGNLLGAEQSGHIYKIGLELYMQMLEEEIQRQRGEAVEAPIEPEIKLPVPAYLPDEYMPDQNQRLAWYKRLGKARDDREIADLKEELIDRYGALPEPAQSLIEITKIKAALVAIRALELAYTGTELAVALADDTKAQVDGVIALAIKEPKTWRITPDRRIFQRFAAKEPKDLFPAIRSLLNRLAGDDTM